MVPVPSPKPSSSRRRRHPNRLDHIEPQQSAEERRPASRTESASVPAGPGRHHRYLAPRVLDARPDFGDAQVAAGE